MQHHIFSLFSSVLIMSLAVPALAQDTHTENNSYRFQLRSNKQGLLPALMPSPQRSEDQLPPKLNHAEPLFIDLIRDLGARQGEEEWNIGIGLTDESKRDNYTFLVEYEWAPIDRLGLEIELPFTFYSWGSGDASGPDHKLNALKAAAQYTFLVEPAWQTSMAVGYIHELELNPFSQWTQGHVLKGNLYNPFFVAAKAWSPHWHSLIYTGPRIEQAISGEWLGTDYEINTSVHYMLPESRNFVGIELNQTMGRHGWQIVARPQMRVNINDHLLLGLSVGIPLTRDEERLSTFIRLIYEPPHAASEPAPSLDAVEEPVLHSRFIL
jgi:hypothetical protein